MTKVEEEKESVSHKEFRKRHLSKSTLTAKYIGYSFAFDSEIMIG